MLGAHLWEWGVPQHAVVPTSLVLVLQLQNVLVGAQTNVQVTPPGTVCTSIPLLGGVIVLRMMLDTTHQLIKY